MKKRIISLIITFILFVTFSLVGCGKNEFQNSCINIRNIFQNTAKMIVVKKTEDKVDSSGKVIATRGWIDNEEAKKYLRSKRKKLDKDYKIIKSYLNESNENYHDALIILLFINDSLYRYSEPIIEDSCEYFMIIEKNNRLEISNWLMDKFWGHIFNNKDTINEWLQLSDDEKSTMVYETLMIPGGYYITKCSTS